MAKFVVIPRYRTRAGLRLLEEVFGPFSERKKADDFAIKYREALEILGHRSEDYDVSIRRVHPPPQN